jgi:hypothetical protein
VMARKAGTPLTESELTIHISNDHVIKNGKHRYVFIDVLSPRIYRLSYGMDNSARLYTRYNQILHRGLYNTGIFYGLRAIDIDMPQEKSRAVSVRLNIIIGEGKDEAKKNF